MTLTAEMIAQERLRLGAAVKHLLATTAELRALIAVHAASGNDAGVQIVNDWIADLHDFSDMLDAAYGEAHLLTPDESGGDEHVDS